MENKESRLLDDKIAIITLCGNYNYGNRLQNYATVFTLNKLGFKCNTIWPKLDLVHSVIDKYKLSKHSEKEKIRYENFKIFTDMYTNPYTAKYNKNLEKRFDKFIVGSDQIWNLKWQLWINKFLVDIDKSKIISFAASFGVSKIQDEDYMWYKKIINNVGFLSVREDRGKELIKEITGRDDSIVIVDPTMLLTDKEWDNVAKKPKMLKSEKYILNYFLGGLSDARKKEIERIARENDCQIINLLDKNSPFYECGPSEFLYLEKHAFLICTDSFHSSVFAVIYNRPFIIFNRDNQCDSMNSRLETLINKFKLENREYNNINITKENLEHDYSKAQQILDEERRKSDSFLRKALNIKESDL